MVDGGTRVCRPECSTIPACQAGKSAIRHTSGADIAHHPWNPGVDDLRAPGLVYPPIRIGGHGQPRKLHERCGQPTSRCCSVWLPMYRSRWRRNTGSGLCRSRRDELRLQGVTERRNLGPFDSCWVGVGETGCPGSARQRSSVLPRFDQRTHGRIPPLRLPGVGRPTTTDQSGVTTCTSSSLHWCLRCQTVLLSYWP
jgi:hypothetical protein